MRPQYRSRKCSCMPVVLYVLLTHVILHFLPATRFTSLAPSIAVFLLWFLLNFIILAFTWKFITWHIAILWLFLIRSNWWLTREKRSFLLCSLRVSFYFFFLSCLGGSRRARHVNLIKFHRPWIVWFFFSLARCFCHLPVHDEPSHNFRRGFFFSSLVVDHYQKLRVTATMTPSGPSNRVWVLSNHHEKSICQ